MPVDYRVRLDAFQGPLDLLLYLIRRAEVDVTNIPVAVIADQYLDHLRAIERIDIDAAGEFLVMAAMLMEIKSRMLAPPAEGADAGEATDERRALQADPRADLVRQLLEYKRLRDSADALDSRRAAWERQFPVRRIGVDDEAIRAALLERAAEIEIEDLDLVELARAHARIIETVNLDRLGDHKVVYDDTPIEIHAADVLDLLRRDDPGGQGLELATVFAGRTRAQMIGVFLAVLELVRRNEAKVWSEAGDRGIRLSVRAGAAPDTATPT